MSLVEFVLPSFVINLKDNMEILSENRYYKKTPR
jgi:hypothetical protein